MTKTELRKIFREKRNALSLEERKRKAAQLIEQFHKSGLDQHSAIASYLPIDNEMPPPPIIPCYLPKTLNDTKTIKFIRYQPGDALSPHPTLHQLEPVSNEAIELQKLDIVFIPLVAFDEQGYRLGLGLGCYDKTFASKKSNPKQKPLLIGLAYDCQKANALPIDPWDIQLDGILTESSFLRW